MTPEPDADGVLTAIVPRAAAVDAIAGAIDARTHYVVGIVPTLVETIGQRIEALPRGWVVFVDKGTTHVLTANHPAGLTEPGRVLGRPVAAVLLVPKSIPADQLNAIMPDDGDDLDDGGNDDVIMLNAADEPRSGLPRLLHAAIEKVDPHHARALQLGALCTPQGRQRPGTLLPEGETVLSWWHKVYLGAFLGTILS